MRTLPKTNMAPENRPSQEEIHLPTIVSGGVLGPWPPVTPWAFYGASSVLVNLMTLIRRGHDFYHGTKGFSFVFRGSERSKVPTKIDIEGGFKIKGSQIYVDQKEN